MKDFVSIAEAARRLGVNPRTLQRAVIRSKIKQPRIGSCKVINMKDAKVAMSFVRPRAGNPGKSAQDPC